MSVTNLLVLNDDPPPRLEKLAGRAAITLTDEAGLRSLLPQADALLVWNFTSEAVRAAWPGEGPRPRWVHTASAGVDRLMCPELTASPTVVTNARGVFDQPIAEYVLGLVLALAKDFPGTWERQQRHHWQHRETQRVAGTRAVVVGVGPIGRAIGRLLEAVGIEVAFVGRTQRPGVHGRGELPGLLARADWVVCVAPLTPDTRGMFDRAAFAAMPSSAVFINVGRGQLVVQDDLVAALVERELAAAALDVFASEPLAADDPLWEVPGLFVSPHMSGDTVGWRDALGEQFLANFDRWEAGMPLLNVVDKERGYVAEG